MTERAGERGRPRDAEYEDESSALAPRRRPRRSARSADDPVDRRAARGGRGAALRARIGRDRPNAGTGGAFGLSSTRRAALLALVVCALILSIAVPLRTYLSQREQLREQTQQSEQLRHEVAQLQQEQGRLSDPAQIEAEARRRLRYVKPGETPYAVQLPPPPPQTAAPQQQSKPWYQSLWESISGSKP